MDESRVDIIVEGLRHTEKAHLIWPHPDRFFMVFVEDGGMPVVKHKDFKSAKHAAVQMSIKTQRRAYVLCSTYGVKFKPSETVPPAL